MPSDVPGAPSLKFQTVTPSVFRTVYLTMLSLSEMFDDVNLMTQNKE